MVILCFVNHGAMGEGDIMISFKFHFILILFALYLPYAIVTTGIRQVDGKNCLE